MVVPELAIDAFASIYHRYWKSKGGVSGSSSEC